MICNLTRLLCWSRQVGLQEAYAGVGRRWPGRILWRRLAGECDGVEEMVWKG